MLAVYFSISFMRIIAMSSKRNSAKEQTWLQEFCVSPRSSSGPD
jgi:hypothetical protein